MGRVNSVPAYASLTARRVDGKSAVGPQRGYSERRNKKQSVKRSIPIFG